MQLQKLSLCGFLAILFFFSSCDGKVSDEFPDVGTWYFYDQTKCADVWDTYPITVPSLEGYIEYHFSTTTDVIIDEIQILDDGAEEQSCEACTCTTGTRIRVMADTQYQSVMEAEGFTLE